MSKPFKALIAGGIVGAIAWALREYGNARAAEGQAVVIPVAMPVVQPDAQGNAFRDVLTDSLFDYLGGLLDGGAAAPVADYVAPVVETFVAPQSLRKTTTGSTGPLLAMIRRIESGNNYSAVWGRIAQQDRPKKRLVTMTIGEVLAWQDSIDAKYNSEAAGAYQILEDTLRGLYVSAGLRTSDLFSVANQDRLGLALLQRRGLASYQAGRITDKQFAQNLSQEWASLPAQTRDKRGRAASGQSYYAGDGLNKSLTTQSAVLAAVRKI